MKTEDWKEEVLKLIVPLEKVSEEIDKTTKSLSNFVGELSVAQQLFKDTGIVASSAREAESTISPLSP